MADREIGPRKRSVSLISLRRIVPVLFACLALCACAGCAHLPIFNVVDSFNPFARKGGQGIDPYVFQLELMRFADEYIAMVEETNDELALQVRDAQSRLEIHAMKMSLVKSALSIAVEPNPAGGAMDMVVLTSLSRIVFDEQRLPWLPREHAAAVAVRYARSEDEAWKLAEQVLLPVQQQELREAIRQWREQNPFRTDIAFVRIQNLFPAENSVKQPSAPSSIFGLLFIDPFAGLKPAAREIELARQATERAMWQAQRLPKLAGLQLNDSLLRARAESEELLDRAFKKALTLVLIIVAAAALAALAVVLVSRGTRKQKR